MDRYDKLRKIDRNKLLIKHHGEFPDTTYEELGKIFNISRQRAWEIISNHQKNNIRGGNRGS